MWKLFSQSFRAGKDLQILGAGGICFISIQFFIKITNNNTYSDCVLHCKSYDSIQNNI